MKTNGHSNINHGCQQLAIIPSHPNGQTLHQPATLLSSLVATGSCGPRKNSILTKSEAPTHTHTPTHARTHTHTEKNTSESQLPGFGSYTIYLDKTWSLVDPNV